MKAAPPIATTGADVRSIKDDESYAPELDRWSPCRT